MNPTNAASLNAILSGGTPNAGQGQRATGAPPGNPAQTPARTNQTGSPS